MPQMAVKMTNIIKVVLVSFGSLVVSTAAFSQINKGQWLIGGNAAFSYEKTNYQKVSSFQLSPDGGYFFIDKLAAGIRPGFGSETSKNINTARKYRLTNVLAAAFARYYFLEAERKVNLFADASYGFGHFNDKDLTPSTNYQPYKYNYQVLSFMAGPAIFLNEHTALEITFGYSHSTGTPPPASFDTLTVSRFQLGIGLQIHLGKHNVD